MGLRPSVNNDHNNSRVAGDSQASSSSMSPTSNESVQQQEVSKGNTSSSTSSASSTIQTQREAWTVRGQLLLNFHHAISRAINSPEMSRKCLQIAADIPHNEGVPPQQQQLVPLTKHASKEEITSTAHQSISDQYSAEAALIVENKSKRDATVRNKSIALGLFSFVTLRSGRGLSSWVRKSMAANSSGRLYQFDRMRNGKNIESTATNAAAATVALQQQPSKLRKFLGVAFDATISTSITLLSGTFLFMPRPSSYIEDMSKLPLVEGKSVYAEMVCPPLLKEYRRVLEQYGGRWPIMGTASNAETDNRAQQCEGGNPQLTQEDVSLNVIRTFVENCSKRSKYERALLEERNALSSFDDNNHHQSIVSRMMRRTSNGSNCDKYDSSSMGGDTLRKKTKLGTVSIPSPGVPDDISVNLDQDVLSLVADCDRDEADDGNTQS